MPEEQILCAGDCTDTSISENNSDAVEHGKRLAKEKLPDRLESRVITSKCRYGIMSFFDFDGPIGLSLALYGEWAQNELEMIAPFVPKGGTVVDVGSNVGTHAMAFASMVGDAGSIIAFEPQDELHALLSRNAANNPFGGVIRPIRAGVAARPGRALVPRIMEPDGRNLGAVRLIPCSADMGPGDDQSLVDLVSIDGLHLDRLSLLKIDVEGDEKEVLLGGEKTIRTLRPVVCCESDNFTRSWPPLKLMLSWGYAAFYIRINAFNEANYLSNKKNVFGNAEEALLLFLPEERLLAREIPAPEMSAYRILNSVDFARALLGMAAYAPSDGTPGDVRKKSLSVQLDESSSCLRCKRAEERCVAANKSVKNLHRRAKSLRKELSEAYAALDDPDKFGKRSPQRSPKQHQPYLRQRSPIPGRRGLCHRT